MNLKEAKETVGSLGKPSKMPCPSYNTPATLCVTGSRLRKNKLNLYQLSRHFIGISINNFLRVWFKIKLQDTNYRTWLRDIIKPFNNPSLSLEDNIIGISRNIKQAI